MKVNAHNRRKRLSRLASFTRNLKLLNAPWRVYAGNRTIPLEFPAKIVNASLPAVPKLAGQVPVHITDSQVIGYKSSAPVASMDAQDFVSYSGRLNLSIVQFEMPLALQEAPPLVQLNLKTLEKANIWYYNSPRITNWHYDGHDNFLFQLKGSKTVRLSQPNTFSCLSVFSTNSNQAKPQQPMKRCFKVTIRAGECLFIPKGWMHQVRSKGSPSVAINYWGNSLTKQIPPADHDIALRYLIGQIATRQTQKMVQLSEKHTNIAMRKKRIMDCPIGQVSEQMLQTPIDFEFLQMRIDREPDSGAIWRRIPYTWFTDKLEETRRAMFMTYLSSLL